MCAFARVSVAADELPDLEKIKSQMAYVEALPAPLVETKEIARLESIRKMQKSIDQNNAIIKQHKAYKAQKQLRDLQNLVKQHQR